MYEKAAHGDRRWSSDALGANLIFQSVGPIRPRNPTRNPATLSTKLLFELEYGLVTQRNPPSFVSFLAMDSVRGTYV